MARAQGTAFRSSARIRTRVTAALRAARRRAGDSGSSLPPLPGSPPPAAPALPPRGNARFARSTPARPPRPPPPGPPAGTPAPRPPPPPPPRRPHTHQLRAARWEPLAEAKETAAAPRRLGSDAGCGEPAWRQLGFACPPICWLVQPPPSPVHLRQAHLPPRPSGVRRYPQRSMAGGCGSPVPMVGGPSGNTYVRAHTHTHTHPHTHSKSVSIDHPARFPFPLPSAQCKVKTLPSPCCLPPGHGRHGRLPDLPALSYLRGLCNRVATPGGIIPTWLDPPQPPPQP